MRGSTGRTAGIVAVVAALAWFAMAVQSARTWSPTTDEPTHLAGGLTILRYGDFRINPTHPPLVKVLCALPAWSFDRPVFHDEQGVFSGFLVEHWVNTNPPVYSLLLPGNGGTYDPNHLFPARLVAILIGFSGGVAVFLLARELGGTRAGLLAAGLLLFYPEYLGHSALVHYDVPLTAACAWVSWTAWRWWRKPGPARLAVFILAGCLASQVKLPALFFVGYVCLVMLAIGFATRFRRVPPKNILVLFAALSAALLATAWVASGFRFSAVAPDTIQPVFVPYLPTGADEGGSFTTIANVLHRTRLLPETTLTLLVNLDAAGGREFFLSGEWRRTGWYRYFLVTFLLKTPLTMIALTCLLAVAAARALPGAVRPRRLSAVQRYRLERSLFVLLPFLAMIVSAILSRFNLGHRYILFAYVPIAVFGGVLLDHVSRRSLNAARAVALAIALFLAEGLAGAPHFATWFNAAAGPPLRYSQVLSDSNTDWGQQTGEMLSEALAFGTPFDYAPWVLTPPQFFGVGEDRYRFVLGQELMPPLTSEVHQPNPALPTVAGIGRLPWLRQRYPGLYGREPDIVRHSYVIFLPAP